MKDKIERRANKKKNRKFPIHGKGMANWYDNVVQKDLKKVGKE